MEALFEIFMIGGIIGGGAYLFLSWQEGRKNAIEEQDNKLAKEQMQSDKWFSKSKPTNIDLNRIADNFDRRSNEMVSEAKTKMLSYYNNSPSYYWFQIIGFALISSVPIVLFLAIGIEYLLKAFRFDNNELMGMYILSSLIISIRFHRHYQK